MILLKPHSVLLSGIFICNIFVIAKQTNTVVILIIVAIFFLNCMYFLNFMKFLVPPHPKDMPLQSVVLL